MTHKVTPAPDKVWVLGEDGALTESDPSHTNQQGAHNKVFLMSANVYGGTISGDPQPADLQAHDAAAIDPLADPIIDQALLGTKYWVTIQATVKKETEGCVIENEAIQNIQNMKLVTDVVSNPLPDIDPALNSVFNYRLNGSEAG